MIRLFGGSVASEAERSQLLSAIPAGPDRDALEMAKIEGLDWGMLQIALIQTV